MRWNYDWEEDNRGPCGIIYGKWIPRDPNYALNKAQKEAEAKAKALPEKPPIPTKDRIAFRVVDDLTGESVPGVLLDIQVPGGFIELGHPTRCDGSAESVGLESGECEVSCDIKDLTLKNTLVFVGVEDDPIEKPKDGEKAEGIPPPEPSNRYRVAFVEKHKVKLGETLKGVAQTAGVDLQALVHFNWDLPVPLTVENYARAESYFNSADIIYIPKTWSQKGFLTNQQYTLRVKQQRFIEDDLKKRADDRSEPVSYIYDPKLNNGRGEFRFVFEEGSLRCSHAIGENAKVCDASSEKRTAIEEHHSFVYLDVGCWVDNADGEGKHCRNFALVCGPHIYLCKGYQKPEALHSRVASVQKFFDEMTAQGCGVEVVSYACANTKQKKLEEDSQLYLFLGDLHLPPKKWAPGFHTVGDYLTDAHGQAVDIFGDAGYDLSAFLRAIIGCSSDMRKLLHFIQVGDMYELWLSEFYLFKPGKERPEWESDDAPEKVIEWVKAIEERNLVTQDFTNLQNANLVEVRFVWGNHDDYLQKEYITKKCNIPERDPAFEGLSGEIFCEHGHRFDSDNFDNDGKFLNLNIWANIAYLVPVTRSFEKFVRDKKSSVIKHPQEIDCYLRGAVLEILHSLYNQHITAFSAYIMAHTHTAKLFRCVIREVTNS